MRGHAPHAFPVALPSFLRRAASQASPPAGGLPTGAGNATLPSAPVRPGLPEERRGDAGVAAGQHERYPSGGYQVHNGRAASGVVTG